MNDHKADKAYNHYMEGRRTFHLGLVVADSKGTWVEHKWDMVVEQILGTLAVDSP